jgi:uncharacterized protein (TIGR00369 family)
MNEQTDWITMDEDGFFGLIGPVFHLAIDDRTGRFRFLPEPKHRNRSNFVHGGLLTALADRALGTTARQMDPTRRLSTVQLDVHFVRAARIGDMLEMECRIVRETQNLIFLDGTISARDQVIALARGVWSKRR